jgi:CRP-like cAMP-binding protein
LLKNFLDRLSAEDAQQLLARGRLHRAAAGEEIARQGTPGDCLYVVESGELAIVRRVPGNEEEVLDTVSPGTLVGELTVLDRRPRSAHLRARRPSVLRVIDQRSFESLTLDGSASGHRILRAVAASLYEHLAASRRDVAARSEHAAGAVTARRPAWFVPSWSDAIPEDLRVLDALALFSTMRPAEVAQLTSGMASAAVPKGAEFRPSGEGQAGAAFVVRGAVSPFLSVGDGAAVSLPVVSPGSFVDHARLVGRSDERLSWRARSATIVGLVPAEAFSDDAATGARLLYALCRDLAIALRGTSSLAMHLGMAWDPAGKVPETIAASAA